MFVDEYFETVRCSRLILFFLSYAAELSASWQHWLFTTVLPVHLTQRGFSYFHPTTFYSFLSSLNEAFHQFSAFIGHYKA